jgi:RNA ligase (TIGR02306 family)
LPYATCGKICAEGEDVSELLGIIKYEAPVPAALAGEVRGMFPSLIPKTDQERVQNLKAELAEWFAEDLHWEVTEKLEGSSMTVYCIDGEVGVCSRNLDLKRNPDNSLWRAAIKYDLEEKLKIGGRNLAVQGELVGNGIQGNIYQMRDQDFLVYDIYDIDAGRYFTPAERKAFVSVFELNHCPVLAYSARLTDTLGLTNLDQVLKFAEGKSVMGMIGCEREGIVFKCHEKQVSFKAISNKYLLKHGG